MAWFIGATLLLARYNSKYVVCTVRVHIVCALGRTAASKVVSPHTVPWPCMHVLEVVGLSESEDENYVHKSVEVWCGVICAR